MEQTIAFSHLVQRWGCSISEAILESDCNYFSVPEIEGFIGYHLHQGCAIALGDPICPPDQKAALAEAFSKYCQEKGLSIIYFIATESFAKWAIQHVCQTMVEVGEEIVIDPFFDPTQGSQGAKLRNKLHHAQHVGLSVHEYKGQDKALEEAILRVGQSWQQARKGPQIYLSQLNFFDSEHNHRWFYLQGADQKVIGMASLSRLDAYQGWLLKFLMTVPEAPRGSSELLTVSVMETLKQEGCRFVTYGMVPAENLREIVGMEKFGQWVLRLVFKSAKWIFHLGQRKIYWKQFQPRTEKCYLLFSHSIGIKEIFALGKALKIDF